MRKLLLVCCMGVMMTGAVSAQQPTNTAWAEKLFGGMTTKDFGAVAKGVQLKYSFKITNIYAVPLNIAISRVTCGCVTGTLSKPVLQPNETGTLDINMDSRRVNGSKTVNVFVTVGPQFISTAMLTVSASTIQDVVLNPGKVDFGIVQRGKAPIQSISVEYIGAQNWRLTEIVKNGNAPFELKVEDNGHIVNGIHQAGYRIYATLKADAAPGSFDEEILLKTNDPTGPVLTFNIVGNVQASLTVAKSQIAFTNVVPGVVQEQKVVIRGSQPFKISRIDGMGQGISCTFDDRPATIHVLTVLCEMAQPAEVRKVLTIHSDLESETVQVVVEAK